MTGTAAVPIVGRHDIRERLNARLERLSAGEGSFVLLAGPPGIGKTTLVESILCKHPVAVCVRCRALPDSSWSYMPLALAVERLIQHPGEYEDAIPPMGRHLRALTGESQTPIPETGGRRVMTDSLGSFFLQLAARRPLVLFIDDLHWADAATLETLLYLAEGTNTAPLMVVGCYRSSDLARGHRLRWLRNELRRIQRLEELWPRPFSSEETVELLERCLGGTPSPALAERIHEHTRGLPLFVVELANAMRRGELLEPTSDGLNLAANQAMPVPETIRDTVLIRMENLPPESRAMLELAALAGIKVDPELLSRITKNDRALDSLFEDNWLVEKEPSEAVFSHALIRDAVISTIPWGRRRALNRQLAEAMEEAAMPAPLVGARWQAGGEPARARHHFLRAARRDMEIGAYWDAAATLETMLLSWPEEELPEERLEALGLLATCAKQSGRFVLAEKCLKSMLSHSHGDRSETWQALAAIYEVEARWGEAARARREAAAGLEAEENHAAAAGEYLSLGQYAIAGARLSEAEEHLGQACALAHRAGDYTTEARAMALLAYAKGQGGKAEEANADVQRAIAIAREHDLNDLLIELHYRLGSIHLYGSRLSEASAAFARVIEESNARGDESRAFECMGCQSYTMFRTGQWARAVEIGREVVHGGKAPVYSILTAKMTLGMVHIFRGELKQGRRYIDEARSLSERGGVQFGMVLPHWAMGLAADFSGDIHAAESEYRALLDAWPGIAERQDVTSALCWAASFLADRAHERDVGRIVGLLSSAAGQSSNPETAATLLLVLGEASAIRGLLADAADQFARASVRFEEMGMPLEQTLCEFRLGRALARRDETEEAIRRFESAARRARNLAARPLVARIEECLKRVAPPDDVHADPETGTEALLTPRQLEIVRLIAEGLTNKEIAARLYLSPRTVEMHAANALARLDCRTRADAVRRAGELGLIGP